MKAIFAACWALAASLAVANPISIQKRDHDNGQKLTKPPLRQSLDALEPGLERLPSVSYTYDQWGAGWIPEEIKTIVTSVGGLNFNPSDFLIYNVHYQDCSDAWVMGMHKSSPITIDSLATQFSKVPIQMRQWVRHVITVPGDNGWAFEYDGSLTFIRPVDNMVSVMIHETGHSLDLNGAYTQKPLSSSDYWWDNYNQDSNVPDPYAQTNAIEDVAQNTVVSVFNENVQGGFGSVEPNWNAIFHQYATLIAAGQPGQGHEIWQPGMSGTASHRLPNSAPVPMSSSSQARNAMVYGAAPDVRMSNHTTLIDNSFRREKHSGCTLKFSGTHHHTV